MSDLDPPVTAVADAVRRALAEDQGILGDITSIATVPDNAVGRGVFASRSEGVMAGTRCATEVYAQLDSAVSVEWQVQDGEDAEAGAPLGIVEGPVRALLGGERTALNFLSHLSGVATTTRRFVRSARGRVRIRDTRKTIPGLRALQKAAVRAGGGFNHRESLSDAILIKDNHLVQLTLEAAVERARVRWPGRPIEVECDTVDQVSAARRADVDVVLLDNMTPTDVAGCVALLDGAALVEISGGIDIDTVTDYLSTGADYIAVGALTHSARALDVGLDLEAVS
ncbi:MAG: carboxylating nicotinate-nucleotide diphosphorylase [Acidimicrobiia bacterium]|nr:carboxylating nicotinate-nucleotide diphosphorylase [Acidimicrobiia bacterium]